MRYSLSKEFVWKETGGRVVVLQLDSGRYYTLNPSGSLIWKGLIEGLSVDRIIDRLCADFEVDKSVAQQDTGEIIRDLLSKEAILEV